MFLFWVGQALTTVGLVFGVVRLTGIYLLASVP